MFKSNISHNLINRQFIKKLTIQIIYNSIDRNIPSYIYMFKEVRYHKLIILLIQYRLIDCEG